MRILFFESNWANVRGLPDGLRDTGHVVKVSGTLTEKNIPLLIREFQPDFILTMGWGHEQSVHKQKLIRKYVELFQVPLVYWATEDPNFTDTFTLPLIKRMKPDFVFSLSSEKVQLYNQMGIKAAHMDFGFHPSVHYPAGSHDEYECNIAVVANAYPDVLGKYPDHYRHTSLRTLICPLLQQSIRVDIWGNSWEAMKPFLGFDIPQDWYHRFLPFTEANKVYSSAKIIIGLQNYTTQVSRRTREILASGGLLLTSDTPEVRRLYTPGRDLIVSSSPEETLRLVQYYLNHPNECDQIRKQGRLAVQNDTYTHRAQYVIEVLSDEGIINTN